MELEQLIRGGNFATEVTFAPRRDRIASVSGYNDSPLNHDDLIRQLQDATESKEVRRMYLGDISSIFGRALNKVMDWRGYQKRMPDHYTYLDLPEQVMAATITADNGTIILAYNIKHAEKLRNNALLRKYVNLHEHGHVRREHSESQTEGLVGDAAYLVRKALQPIYEWSKRAREAFDNALAIQHYAAAREAAQYGR